MYLYIGIPPFNAPFHQNIPSPLNCEKHWAGQEVMLACAKQMAGNAELCLDKPSTLYRYQSVCQTVMDTNHEARQCCDMTLARLQLILLPANHPTLSDYHCIPIAKINAVRADNRVSLAEDFIPTCLTLEGSYYLTNKVKEVLALITIRAESLRSRMNGLTQACTAEVSDLLLLQLLNGILPWLNYVIHTQAVPPLALYHRLTELHAQLLTYTSDERHASTFSVYIHTDLSSTFNTLLSELEYHLGLILRQNAYEITLVQNQFGLWLSEPIAQELIDDANFVLCIKFTEQSDEVVSPIPHFLKVGSATEIHELISRGLPGLSLEPLTSPPRQLPYDSDSPYFAIEKNSELWRCVEESTTLAIHCTSDSNDLTLQLWAVYS